MSRLPLVALRPLGALGTLGTLGALAASAVVALVPSAPGALAQGAAGRASESRASESKAPVRPPAVVGCTALANLRSLLRNAGEDRTAALAVASDPKSDLGCSLVDRAAVTGLADHVALNGRAYDCLILKGTAVCHWTVAGAVTPPERPAGKPPRAGAGAGPAGRSGGAGNP